MYQPPLYQRHLLPPTLIQPLEPKLVAMRVLRLLKPPGKVHQRLSRDLKPERINCPEASLSLKPETEPSIAPRLSLLKGWKKSPGYKEDAC